MPRPSSLLLLFLLSGVVGVAIGCYGDNPALAELPGAPLLADFLAAAPAAPWVAGAASGLLVFLALGFFAPAIVDGWALAALSERLQKLAPHAAPETFRSAFGKSPLRLAGRLYSENLWQGRAPAASLDAAPLDAEPATGAPAWRSSLDPEIVFRPAGEMRESIGRLFGSVSLMLAAIGIAAFALPGRDGAGAVPNSPAISELGVAGLGIAGLGLAAFLGIRVLTHIRGQLVTDIAYLCHRLFRPSGSEYLADRVAVLIAADGRAGRDAILEGFAASMAELKNTLASHDRRIAASVAAAVQRAVQPITTSVQDMLTSLEAASSARSEQLLQAVLTEFLSGFQQRFGSQMAELGEVMAGTKHLAEDLRQSLAASETTLTSGTVELSRTVLETVRDAVEEAVAQQTEAMRTIVQNVDDTVLQTGAALERLGARSDAAMTLWTERTEAIARAVLAGSTEELKQTAAAFNRVHSILETLSISVLPAINKLVTTQERLQSAVVTSTQSAQSASAAASELGEAARLTRDMVERQILLTRELAQLTHGGGGLSPVRPSVVPTPSPAPGSDLARAIDDLRAETDDERRSLPNL